MEKRKLWVRIGAYIEVTDEDLQIISQDKNNGAERLRVIIESTDIICTGNTYIPAESIENFNDECGTNHLAKDIDFEY